MPSRQPQQTHTVTTPSIQTQAPLSTRPFATQTEQSIDPQQTHENSSALLERTSQISHSLSKIAIGSAEATHPQPIQAKLDIGAPDDKYEKEADLVADQVVNRIQASSISPLQRADVSEEEDLQMKPLVDSIQRVELPEEELQMKDFIQRQPGAMSAPSDVEQGIEQARGKGQPLDNTIRQPMEQAFGADFSNVRVHTGGKADHLNQSIQARAFTTGQDVFFRQGEYQPSSRGGQELLAHELTHVVQQNGNGLQRSYNDDSTIKPSSNHLQNQIQRETWVDGDVTWQGYKDTPPRRAQQEGWNCWATAIGVVLGISQEVIQTYMPISVYQSEGISESEEVTLLKKLKTKLKKNLSKISWAGIKGNPGGCTGNLPMALGVSGHYLVLCAIGFEGDVAKYVRVWDPADANYIEEDLDSFESSQSPEYGYYKS